MVTTESMLGSPGFGRLPFIDSASFTRSWMKASSWEDGSASTISTPGAPLRVRTSGRGRLSMSAVLVSAISE
jgi:hypothetical protein